MPDGSVAKVRRGRKFDQVLAGAREVFMADGFEGASVDDIARAAKVSKATLYSYFPDKRLLFLEVAKHECARQSDHALETINLDLPVREVLLEGATQLLGFITSQMGQRIYRICCGECERFPVIGKEFYESGPGLVNQRLIGFFTIAVERGELRIDDIPLAAEQFHALCKSGLFDRAIFHKDELVTQAGTTRVINGAIDMFMARYGAEPNGEP